MPKRAENESSINPKKIILNIFTRAKRGASSFYSTITWAVFAGFWWS